MNQKLKVLYVLALALTASITWSFFNYPRPRTVSSLKHPPGSKAVAKKKRPALERSATKNVDTKKLRIDLLEQPGPDFSGYRRNIFQPIFIDRETMMARLAAEAAEKARKARAQIVVKPPPVPSRTQQELSRFKYHGFAMKAGRKAVFLSKGDEISVLKQNDKFEGRYLVTAITDQLLILKVTGTGEELILPLDDGGSVSR